MSVKKDTEYLSVSSRVRAMETRLLTRERLERMIDAPDDMQALKILSECGFGEIGQTDPAALETALNAARIAAYRELAAIVPDQSVLDIFRAKYDYHNAKVLLKSGRIGRSAEPLLLNGGRYDPVQLSDDLAKGSPGAYSSAFRLAVESAAKLLAEGGDAQAADMLLDQAYYAEMSDLTDRCGNRFLQEYIRLSIDAANLRTCVRCARMERDALFLSNALLEGGSVSRSALVKVGAQEAWTLYRGGELAAAAELADSLAKPDGAPLTAFERACDDALMRSAQQCRRVPFGQEVVIGYLLALEAELTAVRIVMAGRRVGLDGDVIRQRLRACYV